MSMSSYVQRDGLRLAERLCEEQGFPLDFLRRDVRGRSAVLVRHHVMWCLAKDTDLSFPEIGAIFRKDHTSVIHAVRAENERQGANVRGMKFPAGYRERNRQSALLYAALSREVLA